MEEGTEETHRRSDGTGRPRGSEGLRGGGCLVVWERWFGGGGVVWGGEE